MQLRSVAAVASTAVLLASGLLAGCTGTPTASPSESASAPVSDEMTAVPLSLEGDWVVTWTIEYSDADYDGFRVGDSSSVAWRFTGVSCEDPEAGDTSVYCTTGEEGLAVAASPEDLDAGTLLGMGYWADGDVSVILYDADLDLVNFTYPSIAAPCFDEETGAEIAATGNELANQNPELTPTADGGWTVLWRTILRNGSIWDKDGLVGADGLARTHPDYVVEYTGTVTRR